MTAPQQLWPIGQNAAPSESDDDVSDVSNDRTVTSIFHDELASHVHIDDPVSQTGRPMSMFEVPLLRVGRAVSTATMTTGEATKDVERTPGSMSDEARTAMMYVARHTPNVSSNNGQSSAGNWTRAAPPPSKPGVPLAKIATEVQAARQLSTNAMAIIHSSSASDGQSDARTPASLQAACTTLYPGLGSGSSGKTLLDYYSARAAERSVSRADQATRQQFSPPRVTLSFFPSRDKDAMSPPAVTPSPIPAAHELPTAERSPCQQLQYPPRRLQSAAVGLRASTVKPGHRPLNAAVKSEQSVVRPTTCDPTALHVTVEDKTSSTPDNSRGPPLKVADRKLYEPLRVASSTTETHAHPRGEASSGSGAQRPQNSSHGAATDVFLSSILSHLIPAPPNAERDWGHFTLVKPSPTANVDIEVAKRQSLT